MTHLLPKKCANQTHFLEHRPPLNHLQENPTSFVGWFLFSRKDFHTRKTRCENFHSKRTNPLPTKKPSHEKIQRGGFFVSRRARKAHRNPLTKKTPFQKFLLSLYIYIISDRAQIHRNGVKARNINLKSCVPVHRNFFENTQKNSKALAALRKNNDFQQHPFLCTKIHRNTQKRKKGSQLPLRSRNHASLLRKKNNYKIFLLCAIIKVGLNIL